MGYQRLKAVADGQTGIAKRVLEAVPIKESWPVKAITAELSRTGTVPDPRIVMGCLRSLCDSGLIREHPTGCFARIYIKTEPKVTLVQPTPAPTPVPQKLDPMTRLANMAAVMRNMAEELEDIALAIEEDRTASLKEVQQLRELKNLLKGLT